MHKTIQVIHDEHSSISAMLQSMNLMIERGPKDNPRLFFDVLKAMLFYIEEFPERLHHPKESKYFSQQYSNTALSLMKRLIPLNMNIKEAATWAKIYSICYWLGNY